MMKNWLTISKQNFISFNSPLLFTANHGRQGFIGYIKITVLSFLFFFAATSNGWGQTTLFSDNFTTSTGTAWDVSGAIGTSSEWYLTRSGVDYGARINGGRMELTNDASSNGNANGYAFVWRAISGSGWNSTLANCAGPVTWEFNMRQIRTDPSGFNNGNYGVAFVLAGTSAVAGTTGQGYAVVLGQSGSTDPIRLVRYNGGFNTNSSVTNIITSNTSGLADFGTNYLSIRVTYNPANNSWELFVRNDGTSAFTDPSTGSLVSQGTATNNTYTSTSGMDYMGGYWEGANGNTQTAFFDNIYHKICSTPTAPTVSTITQPSCTTSTGSVALSGLPSSGTWTVTGTPSGSATGSGSTGTVTGLAANTTYTFTVTNASGCTSIASSNAVVNAQPTTPSQPSAITGTLNPEIGTSQTYTVTNVAGVTYTWSFPATWSITGGQGTNSVSVTVGTQNGTISVTPSNSCGNGTARTATTTIPNFRVKFISMNYGSGTWCAGESRNVSVTLMNNGVSTWSNTTPDINIGVKWNTQGVNWTDYHVRTDANNLAPGQTQTFSLTIEAKNATAGPSYSTKLQAGINNLTFNVVNEANCWFSDNSGLCGPGNSVLTSPNITIINSLDTISAGSDAAICKGQSTQLSGSATGPSIVTTGSQTFSYSGSGFDCNNFSVGGTTSGIPAGATITSIVWSASMNVSCSWSEMDLYINNTYIGWTCGATNITYNGLNGQPANGQTLEIDSWDKDFYCDFMTMNFSFTVNYTYLAPATVSYSWSPATGLSNANIANPTASPIATTTYTITATSNGCSVSDDVIVTVNNYGIDGSLAASTTTSVCVNNPITVTAASGDGNPRYWLQSPVGAATWNIADNQASNSAANGYTFTPTSTGTFRIHARWQNNCGFCWDEAGHDWNTNNKCPNFAAVDFTSVAQPSAPTSATKLPNVVSACAGSTLTLTGAASGGEEGLSCSIEYQYSTNNGTNWTSTGTTIPSFAAATGTNIIQARRASCQSGCGTTSWNTIASWTVIANPTANISGTNTICLGGSSNFTASGGATYVWNTGATTAAITIATANTYTVTVTDANGCTSSTNRTLTVNQPNTNISVNGISISNGDYLWNGSSNANWDVVANWYVFNGSNYTVATTLPTTSTNVFISSSAGQCVSNTNNVAIPANAPNQSVKDINISSGSQVVLAGSNSFNVSGNWNNAGTFNATAGTIVFNGNINQTFNCSGGSALKDITLQNTALNGKLTMNSNLTINGNIQINQGELVVPATRIVRSNNVNMGSNGKLLLGGEMRVNE